MYPYISWCNPYREYQMHEEAIMAAVHHVMDSGQYVLGNEVLEFEKAFGEYFDYSHVTSVGNGTDALYLALRALDIKSGDEVITTAHTALPTISAIVETGATPVLVDIEEDYYCIDPTKIEAQITDKTKAIIVVHIYGMPCDMDPIEQLAQHHHIPLIEDCAQAHGAKYRKRFVGHFGALATFSFYPTKNLGCIGDGGAVVSANHSLYEKLTLLRQYGWDANRISQVPGINSRLDEIQAAILKVKLKHFHDFISERQRIQETYIMELKNTKVILPKQRDFCESVGHLFVVRHPNRSQFIADCKEQNIGVGIHYPVPVHHNPGYKDLIKLPKEGLPVLEKITKEIVSLPIYPGLSADEQAFVIEAIRHPKHISAQKKIG